MKTGSEYRAQKSASAKAYWAQRPGKRLYADCKQRASKKGLRFALTQEQVDEMLGPMTCAATGVQLRWNEEGELRNPHLPSLDRIDSSLGYVDGNVRVTSWVFNRVKGNLSDEELQILARQVIAMASRST